MNGGIRLAKQKKDALTRLICLNDIVRMCEKYGQKLDKALNQQETKEILDAVLRNEVPQLTSPQELLRIKNSRKMLSLRPRLSDLVYMKNDPYKPPAEEQINGINQEIAEVRAEYDKASSTPKPARNRLVELWAGKPNLAINAALSAVKIEYQE